MSHADPIHQLSHEHRYILKVVHGLSAIDQELAAGRVPDLARLRNIVAFMREFADQCHHAKEEAILFPAMLRRLYVALDDDPAGMAALKILTARAKPAGIEIVPIEPRLDDFNSDLCAFGRERMAPTLRGQLRAGDTRNFLLGGR